MALPRRPRTATSTAAVAAATGLLSSSVWLHNCHGFTANNNNCNTAMKNRYHSRQSSSSLYVFAPPGSGYVRSTPQEDEESATLSHPELSSADIEQISPNAFPDTYEPMLEYPGTMRPGRTPENMPYHDLPNLGIHDDDPVPWPHFQEIEWHHRWDPPHEQALAMEEFIEVQGRWASVEDEAEMRMGMRRGVRERREMEELPGGSGIGAGSGEQMVIMDDDEEEDGGAEDTSSIAIGLGEGVEALLKSAASAGGGSDTVTPSAAAAVGDNDEEDDDEDDDEDEGDFLLDLGLGLSDDDEEEEEEEEKPAKKASSSSKKTVKMEAGEDEDDDDEGDLEDDLDLDFELGFDLDEDEDEDDDEDDEGDFDDYDDDDDDMSLDDYTKEDDGGDDDDFDDGGFDYGD